MLLPTLLKWEIDSVTVMRKFHFDFAFRWPILGSRRSVVDICSRLIPFFPIAFRVMARWALCAESRFRRHRSSFRLLGDIPILLYFDPAPLRVTKSPVSAPQMSPPRNLDFATKPLFRLIENPHNQSSDCNEFPSYHCGFGKFPTFRISHSYHS